MSDVNINQVLAQMRSMSLEAGNKPQESDSEGGSDFALLLKQSIDSVNSTQKQAGQLKREFETGNTDVSLAEVMIASQKASVSFQAMLQVRNKLVDAYQEIMNIPL